MSQVVNKFNTWVILYSLLISLFPILNTYASPIPMVTLSEFLFLLYLLLLIISKGVSRISLSRECCIFLLYIIFIVVYSFGVLDSNLLFDGVGTALRLLVLYSFLFLSINTVFDFNKTKKILINISFLLSVYAIIQFIFSFFGIYLYNFIPFLPDFGGTGGITYSSILNKMSIGMVYRACSLFREPAMVGCYMALPLTLLLTKNDKKLFDFVKMLSIVFALIFSLSGTSLAILVFTFMVCILFSQISITWKVINIVILAILSWLFIVYTPYGNKMLSQLFGNVDEGFFSLDNSSRFDEGFFDYLFKGRSISRILFGSTMATTDIYLSGIPRVFYCLGLVGLIVFFIHLFVGFSKKTKVQKIITILFVFLNIGTEIALGAFAILYLPFIFCKSECNFGNLIMQEQIVYNDISNTSNKRQSTYNTFFNGTISELY